MSLFVDRVDDEEVLAENVIGRISVAAAFMMAFDPGIYRDIGAQHVVLVEDDAVLAGGQY